MGANIGSLISTLKIGNKPCDTSFIFKNKIRILSFKVKQQKEFILAISELGGSNFSPEGTGLAVNLANGELNE